MARLEKTVDMDTQNANKRLLNNTFLYAVGSFGSKILSFLIVPLYSYYVMPDALGYYDVIITTLSLLQPIIILQLSDGVYRWLMSSKTNYERKAIIATTIRILINNVIIASIIFIILNIICKFQYAIWILLLMVLQCIYPVMQQIIRGLQKNKLYAFCGILYTAVMLLVNCIGLILLKSGIEILFISQIIANIVCVIIIFASIPEIRIDIREKMDRQTGVDLLKYSAPLIPTNICWWIVNSSDRYIILWFLGNASNGIYSMANKFPTILSIITNVFYLAWQESALREYESENRDEFFSDIFSQYSRVLFTTALFLIPATKLFIKYMLAASYGTAWYYSGFLFLAVIFNSLNSFLGLGYQISKETKKSLYTTIIAALINIVINVALISNIGLIAASLSTFIAYLTLFVIRICHTRRYYKLSINWKKFLSYLVISILEVVVLYWTSDIVTLVIMVTSIVLFLIANKPLMGGILKSLRRQKSKEKTNFKPT